MIDKVQKIKEWISKTQDGLMDADGNFRTAADEASYNTLCNLDAYIDSLQKEPVSEDLEDAAKQFATDTETGKVDIVKQSSFLWGAIYHKHQMMANAVDGAYIRRNRYTKKNVLNGLDMTCDAIQGFKDKDKIKVLFIKND